MLDELDYPRFIEVIEEALDVGIEYVVHLLFVEDGDHCVLDDLVTPASPYDTRAPLCVGRVLV
jgi:hypothetical protein